jgi:SAM-dependent methyltransferase
MTIAPKRLNIGSGRDFQPDFLNVDINDYWAPDIVADVAADFPSTKPYMTKRFGKVVMAPGSFDQIIANDVLEHVPDLVATMTNCLKLLRLGGAFDIQVPYDLSYGAWQDPTHVRAFNERSWIYYTDWYWYLGWTEARFKVTNSEYIMSPYGHQLMQRGAPLEQVALAPRAVEHMRVRLEKIELSADEKKVIADMERDRIARHAARDAATVR